jgi:probable F420-dependent oxidoreductase
VRIDVWLPTPNPIASGAYLAAVASQAEERGIGTLWVGEHVVMFDRYKSKYPYSIDGKMPLPGETGLLEPFTTLAFLAGFTREVRLGTAMVLLPQRNPVYTAKEVSTLDWLSGGRVEFGIGVGWLREEFDVLGVPWPQRGRRTDEYIDVLRSLWCENPSSFSGQFYEMAPCSMFPKPLQSPHPSLHIGGESDAALSRVARTGQGWHTFNRGPADFADPLARLSALLGEQGRHLGDITVTVCPYFQGADADAVARYADAGVDAVALLLFSMDVEGVEAAFDAIQPCLERARTC